MDTYAGRRAILLLKDNRNHHHGLSAFTGQSLGGSHVSSHFILGTNTWGRLYVTPSSGDESEAQGG